MIKKSDIRVSVEKTFDSPGECLEVVARLSLRSRRLVPSEVLDMARNRDGLVSQAEDEVRVEIIRHLYGGLRHLIHQARSETVRLGSVAKDVRGIHFQELFSVLDEMNKVCEGEE